MRYKVWTDFFPMCGRCHRNNNEMLNKNLLICPDTSSRFKKKKTVTKIFLLQPALEFAYLYYKVSSKLSVQVRNNWKQ